MSSRAPYNPLDKQNLAFSIERALLSSNSLALGPLDRFEGAGVYAIYYNGSFPAYSPLMSINAKLSNDVPIYVGKAVPEGSRKGGFGNNASDGTPLYKRLMKHSSSLSSASNLEIEDFSVRFLTVDDIWIPLGENMLIETFKPLWNREVDGFGNNDPGARRATQYRSPWDVLHPGRTWAEKLADNPLSVESIQQRIKGYFESYMPPKFPGPVE